MLTFWNRKEVYMGYSMSDFADIRSVLAVHSIKYTFKVINACGSNYKRRGIFGEDSKFNYMYYIYVHKRDYEWACELIKGR